MDTMPQGSSPAFDYDYLDRRTLQALGTSRWVTSWQGWEGAATDPDLL